MPGEAGRYLTIPDKIVTEMLFFVFLVLGYCVPIVMARSSAAKVKRLVGNNPFREEETWFEMRTISEEEFVHMKMIVMDRDEGEAFRLLKEFLKRLEQQKNLGLKSHLD